MTRFPHIIVLSALVACTACGDEGWPPSLQQVPGVAPAYSGSEALKTFHLPPGYRIELVAAEPLVQDPVALDFDADGRMYVVEMRGFMPNLAGEGEDRPVGRIVVLEDVNGDGRMDRSTVYLDGLVLPRAIKVLEHGILVAAPPYLWLTRDSNGDGRADVREVVRDDYGDPDANPEHNANGLFLGMDNWIHNAQYDGQLRLRHGRFEHRTTPRLGQWGVTMDDYGRLYRNFNEAPLHADLVPAHYLARNPNLTRTRGAYERLADNGPVWPVRPTPGVNRGYRAQTLRADSTLAHFTAAGSPVVYRGDRLPAELRNDVFVTEPAGNLVRRFVVTEDENGFLRAENAYERAEFLASTDERFRPVNLYSAPDGTLYVVDMYRGVIQHRDYVTDYLKQHVQHHDLEDPGSHGRIYRVVYEPSRIGRLARRFGPRPERPQLSRKSPAELVTYLSHPNGWWRDTAQRLLVERGHRSVASALRELAAAADDERTRLHALWTLDGLEAVDSRTLLAALADSSAHVRAAAIRLAEPWLEIRDHPLREGVIGMQADPTPVVRRQLAASLGEVPGEDRERLLADPLRRYGGDPIVVDLVVSGLGGRELAFLEGRLAAGSVPEAQGTDLVEVLAATVMRAGHDRATQQVFGWVGQDTRPRWQRLALIRGMAATLPGVTDPDLPPPRAALGSPPRGLLTASSVEDPAIRSAAAELLGRLDWPGRPDDPQRARIRPLTAEQQRLFELGRQRYAASCAACHQQSGQGLAGVAAPLVGSRWVLGPPRRLVRIVLQGMEGDMLMPPMANALSDDEIAAVLTYIRRGWGHEASAVGPAFVQEIRGETSGRNRPWTPGELERVRR